MSIYHSSVLTCKYKSALQELLVSIFNSSAIARVQSPSYVARARNASYLQIFSRHEVLLAFFVNLDVSHTVYHNMQSTMCIFKII